MGNVFNRSSTGANGTSAVTYANPTIYKTGGNMTGIGNRMANGPGSSTGTFIQAADGHDDVAFNNAFGWSMNLPSSSAVGGLYTPNN